MSRHGREHADEAGYGRLQLLADHSRQVAELARQLMRLAQPGNERMQDDAHVAGLLHDLGKFQSEWQQWAREYQRRKSREVPQQAIGHTNYDPRQEEDRRLSDEVSQSVGKRPNHASTGAQVAWERKAYHVALAVAGHHAGLKAVTQLKQQIHRDKPEIDAVLKAASDPRELGDLLTALRLEPPDISGNDICKVEMQIRLLFSCLIDADRLDSSGKVAYESSWNPNELLKQVCDHVDRLAKRPGDRRVRHLRSAVFHRCLSQADNPQGVFTLTVPTGGGKTLASMAFALKHATRHHLRRVIMVIPYINIIEQNAAVYREIFGDKVVLEHHSNVEVEPDDESEGENPARLATENWDAPVIVTTSVRFFESLFANRPNACRRVHRIARSVVIFDEVQTFPVHLLTPIMSALKSLTSPEGFGSTLVLCTATQPALRKRDTFPIGLQGVTEIMGTEAEVNELVDQVRYRWSRNDETSIPTLSWEDVATQMVEARRALCVVNVKKHASELFEALRVACCGRGLYLPLFHLSTTMCPAHRKSVLDRIKAIPSGEPCLLAATQCVEAGVDLDFPLVLRALGPIDSIAQAAGRCNREGAGSGRLILFQPEEPRLPLGAYREGAKIANDMFATRPHVDLHAPETFAEYFASLYNIAGPAGWDRNEVEQLRDHLNFGAVARRFKLIDDNTEPVIVRYGACEQLIKQLKRLQEQPMCNDLKKLFRRLQPYTVNLYRRFDEPLAERHDLQGLIERGPFGLNLWNPNHYDANLGVIMELPIDECVV